jgi:hypothetical protein
MTPRSRRSPKGEGNLGDTPRPPVWGCRRLYPRQAQIRQLFRARVAQGLQLRPLCPRKRGIGAAMTPRSRRSPKGERKSGGHPQTPGMGLPPPSPSLNANSGLWSEGGAVASTVAADSTEALDRRRYDPQVSPLPERGKESWGTPPDPRYGAAAPFTLARRHSTPPKTPGMGCPPFTFARRHSKTLLIEGGP